MNLASLPTELLDLVTRLLPARTVLFSLINVCKQLNEKIQYGGAVTHLCFRTLDYQNRNKFKLFQLISTFQTLIKLEIDCPSIPDIKPGQVWLTTLPRTLQIIRIASNESCYMWLSEPCPQNRLLGDGDSKIDTAQIDDMEHHNNNMGLNSADGWWNFCTFGNFVPILVDSLFPQLKELSMVTHYHQETTYIELEQNIDENPFEVPKKSFLRTQFMKDGKTPQKLLWCNSANDNSISWNVQMIILFLNHLPKSLTKLKLTGMNIIANSSYPPKLKDKYNLPTGTVFDDDTDTSFLLSFIGAPHLNTLELDFDLLQINKKPSTFLLQIPNLKLAAVEPSPFLIQYTNLQALHLATDSIQQSVIPPLPHQNLTYLRVSFPLATFTDEGWKTLQSLVNLQSFVLYCRYLENSTAIIRLPQKLTSLKMNGRFSNPNIFSRFSWPPNINTFKIRCTVRSQLILNDVVSLIPPSLRTLSFAGDVRIEDKRPFPTTLTSLKCTIGRKQLENYLPKSLTHLTIDYQPFAQSFGLGAQAHALPLPARPGNAPTLTTPTTLAPLSHPPTQATNVMQPPMAPTSSTAAPSSSSTTTTPLSPLNIKIEVPSPSSPPTANPSPVVAYAPVPNDPEASPVVKTTSPAANTNEISMTTADLTVTPKSEPTTLKTVALESPKHPVPPSAKPTSHGAPLSSLTSIQPADTTQKVNSPSQSDSSRNKSEASSSKEPQTGTQKVITPTKPSSTPTTANVETPQTNLIQEPARFSFPTSITSYPYEKSDKETVSRSNTTAQQTNDMAAESDKAKPTFVCDKASAPAQIPNPVGPTSETSSPSSTKSTLSASMGIVVEETDDNNDEAGEVNESRSSKEEAEKEIPKDPSFTLSDKSPKQTSKPQKKSSSLTPTSPSSSNVYRYYSWARYIGATFNHLRSIRVTAKSTITDVDLSHFSDRMTYICIEKLRVTGKLFPNEMPEFSTKSIISWFKSGPFPNVARTNALVGVGSLMIEIPLETSVIYLDMTNLKTLPKSITSYSSVAGVDTRLLMRYVSSASQSKLLTKMQTSMGSIAQQAATRLEELYLTDFKDLPHGSFPRLQVLTVNHFELSNSMKMPNLKVLNLHTFVSAKLESILDWVPSTLTSLQCESFISTSSVLSRELCQKMPPNLERLVISITSLPNKLRGAYIALENFKYLPLSLKYIHGLSIHVKDSMDFVLALPPKISTLNSLLVGELCFKLYLPNFVPIKRPFKRHCLPTDPDYTALDWNGCKFLLDFSSQDLESLPASLTCLIMTSNILPPSFSKFLPRGLKSLDMRFVKKVEMAKCKSLPPTLLELSINAENVTIDFLSKLPRTLTSLSLHYCATKWQTAFSAALPRDNLLNLEIEAPLSSASINALPKTITRLCLMREAAGPVQNIVYPPNLISLHLSTYQQPGGLRLNLPPSTIAIETRMGPQFKYSWTPAKEWRSPDGKELIDFGDEDTSEKPVED